MLRKRASSSNKYASADLQNLQTIYSINITIGGQSTSVALDTGSSELWVDPDCSTASRGGGGNNGTDASDGGDTATDSQSDSDSSSPAYCESIGRYDPTSSSTSEALGEGTVFQYADTTTVELNYYTDTIDIGGLTITKQQFGVANVTNATSLGIMGMGPNPGYGYNVTQETYSYILDTMASQGQIASRAFSLDLRDYDNATGSIIFGGLDKKKFSGSLQTLPLESVQMYSPSYDNGKTSFTDYGYIPSHLAAELKKTLLTNFQIFCYRAVSGHHKTQHYNFFQVRPGELPGCVGQRYHQHSHSAWSIISAVRRCRRHRNNPRRQHLLSRGLQRPRPSRRPRLQLRWQDHPSHIPKPPLAGDGERYSVLLFERHRHYS